MKLALMSPLLMTLALCSFASTAVAAKPEVELTKNDDGTVAVAVDGKEFLTYQTSKNLPKPFFIPVKTADGAIITRPLENEGSKDHPHHKGVWVAVDEVNDIKFWAEKGKIENVSTELVTPKGNPAELKVTNHWLGEDGNPVLVEETLIKIFANRMMAYDIKFSAGKTPVHFGDTKEGLFGIRLADSLRESEGGKVVNADGLEGTAECWGKPSKWVDYYGMVGEKTYGVTLFDHPKNFRPSRYHVRNYGLFTISPFGNKAYTNGKADAEEVDLEPLGTLRIRYGIYIHDGDTKSANVPEVYEQFVTNTTDAE